MISEIEIGLEILGDTEMEEFLSDEKLKRALGMTVIKNVTFSLKQETSGLNSAGEKQKPRNNCFLAFLM